KALWAIYLGLTLLCAAAYYLAGMSLFDAICHSFATVAIGGFSTHDASIGYFDSPLIEGICMFFMFLAGINFSLHYLSWRHKSLSNYFQDAEFRAYTIVLGLVALLTCIALYALDSHSGWSGLRHGVFQAISISTTAGFTTENFSHWPPFATSVLLLASFIGGCAGSTGGGIKVIRALSLFRQGLREIFLLIHPNVQTSIKIGGKSLSPAIIKAIWGFFALYIASFCLMSLALTATGIDMITAFSSVAACINNLGPALGQAGENFTHINPLSKWILCFAMLLGRLEVFTLLVLFTPWFWKK
ncbi:MAG: potassium transporter, partial [Gammaproteobacteria bacterium]